jgi:putative restriction endonuclease
MPKSLDFYMKLFSKLRLDTNPKRWTEQTTSRAPHKPLLLLSILDLFAQGHIQTNLIEITPELGSLFADYWAIIFPDGRRGNLALPFFHLRTSPFWHLVPYPDQEMHLAQISQVDSLSHLERVVIGVSLDGELFDLLQTEPARNALRGILIQTYFATELHAVLLSQGIVNLETFQYSQQLIKSAKRQARDQSGADEPQYIVRDQGFRRAIVQLYGHRCAFCGVRMMTPDGHSAVEAAHIIPWSVSHNDDPHNGMALCRLCHWTFDEGLTSVSTRYLVVLSSDLRASLNLAGHLPTLENRSILGPEDQDLWPDHDALKWHRQKVFRSL